MFKVFVLLAILAVAFSESFIDNARSNFRSLTKDHSLDAKINDVSFPGTDGFTFRLNAPFKFMDSVVGVSGEVNDLMNMKPDRFFFKKKVEGFDVNAEHDLKDQVTSVSTTWSNGDVTVGASGNTNDMFREVSASFKTSLDEAGRNIQTKVNGAYDLMTKSLSTTLGMSSGDAAVSVEYDSQSDESVVGLSYNVDEQNTLVPSVNLKTKEVKYGLSHKTNNGNIDAVLTPNDNIKIDWTDNASGGAWKTSIDYPLDDRETKVGFSRVFDY
jgi:hypothetical protein